MKNYEVTYQYSDSSKLNTLIIEADYYSINKDGNEVLHFWKNGEEKPIASFASSIWIFIKGIAK